MLHLLCSLSFFDLYQGGSFPFAWKSAIKRTLQKASVGSVHRLDRYGMCFLFTEFIKWIWRSALVLSSFMENMRTVN